MGKFNFTGGLRLTPEFAALLTGLVIYTGAFTAEVVRAGIQAVSKGQFEAARALAWKAARYSDTNLASDLKLTLATKVMCSDSAVKVADEAVQVFGGIGYTKECLVEKLYRDAKITQIYEGTNEIQRAVIALELTREIGIKEKEKRKGQ